MNIANLSRINKLSELYNSLKILTSLKYQDGFCLVNLPSERAFSPNNIVTSIDFDFDKMAIFLQEELESVKSELISLGVEF